MLMATWGGGRVLMTYLQWRSLDGLAHPSKNSCEIRRNNRRVVVVVEGGRRGGFAAAEALHSNSRVCLEWSDPPSSPPPPPPQHPRERGREEVLSGPCSQSPRLVPEYQMWQRTRKVSCLCFVKCAMTKCWGAPLHDPSPYPHPHTHTDTHTCRWTN